MSLRRQEHLAELYRAHSPAGVRLAYLLTGDHELARDLVQDAFVRVFGRLRRLRDEDSFDAYLRRVIVNLAKDHHRRARLEREHLKRQPATVPAAAPADVETHDEMWAALQDLPARQRAAIVLRHYEDLSEQQTADTLGCSVGAVKQLCVRGLESLRAKIGGTT